MTSCHAQEIEGRKSLGARVSAWPARCAPSTVPVDPNHTRRIRMLATAARHTIVRPRLQCFGRPPASLPATVGRDEGRGMRDENKPAFHSSSLIPHPFGIAKLLILDKELALMPEWLRQAFPAPAYRVQVVATGAEGLRQVRIDPPDVILLDPGLPDQSGLGVYEEIRRIDAHIPVIFVTMTNRADGAIEAMRAGAHDYLFKPLDPHELQR